MSRLDDSHSDDIRVILQAIHKLQKGKKVSVNVSIENRVILKCHPQF